MKQRFVPLCVVGLIAVIAVSLVSSHLRKPASHSGLPVDRLMRLPVLEGGRVKPLDTVARSNLLVISRKQYFRDENGDKVSAADWFAELILNPAAARDRKVFRIDHPEVVGLLGFRNEDRKYFSLAEIAPHWDELQKLFKLVDEEPQRRDAFDRELVKLRNSLAIFDAAATSVVVRPLFGSPLSDLHSRDHVLEDLSNLPSDSPDRATARNAWMVMTQHYAQNNNSRMLAVYPPKAGGDWSKVAESLQRPIPTDSVVHAYAQLAEAFRTTDPVGFDAALDELEQLSASRVTPVEREDLGFEFAFNQFSPFVLSIELYILVLLCALMSWLFIPRWLVPTALVLLIAVFALHSFGLFARMDIQNRPPVTNLYSSAIFVGWGAVFICVILELFLRNGVASAAAAMVGFPTLIIAHNLSLSGDTMEVMRAVLDSNFWLATHVVVVTMGYSATFLAGVLAAIYLILDRLAGNQTDRTMKIIGRMVYGVICFAVLFSFVGTILGGIWADQSWGRFWGWDPKENGALMIVLWNAVILHARWGKVASTVGVAQMAVAGNIITAWSWFGTNLLGVGLHSYGFTDSGFFWLMVFLLSQLSIILLGFLPARPRLSEELASHSAPPMVPIIPEPGR